MKLSLEVGKTYRSGLGLAVKIISYDGRGMYPFYGDNCRAYTHEGRYSSDPADERNLICEESGVLEACLSPSGLTTREHFAGMALSGLAQLYHAITPEEAAIQAVKFANALITELENQP